MATKPKVFRAPKPPKPPSPPSPPKPPSQPDPVTNRIAGKPGMPSGSPMLKRGAKGGLYYELPGGRRIYIKR